MAEMGGIEPPYAHHLEPKVIKSIISMFYNQRTDQLSPLVQLLQPYF